MKLLLLENLDEKSLLSEIDRIGADRRSFPFFFRKREILLLSAKGLDVRAANALKQEMLSRGGDIIVHKRTIDCGVKETDALLMATQGQFSRLLEKLGSMPYWGLQEFREALARALRNASRKAWNIRLPRGRSLKLNDTTKIMGIVNLTEDSFYEGSRKPDVRDAVSRALSFFGEGADIVDIGGESTRPGAVEIAPSQEASRIVPVISEIRKSNPDCIISVDTRKSSVARKAVEAGADIVNDVSGLRYDPDMAKTVAELGVPLVLMHSRKTPEKMQDSPTYGDVVFEVCEEMDQSMRIAEEAGIGREAIILDPGLGFAKETDHNLSLMKHLCAFRTMGRPLLVGHSRKSTIGRVLSLQSPADRLEGTLAITAICAWQGISVVRVHDVRENYRAVRMIRAIKDAK